MIKKDGRRDEDAWARLHCTYPPWHLRTTYLMLFRIHGQGIRRATMRMEETSAALLEVARNFVGG